MFTLYSESGETQEGCHTVLYPCVPEGVLSQATSCKHSGQLGRGSCCSHFTERDTHSESQHNVSVLHGLWFQSQISNPGLGDSSALLFFPQHRTASHGFPEIEPGSVWLITLPVTKSSRKSRLGKDWRAQGRQPSQSWNLLCNVYRIAGLLSHTARDRTGGFKDGRQDGRGTEGLNSNPLKWMQRQKGDGTQDPLWVAYAQMVEGSFLEQLHQTPSPNWADLRENTTKAQKTQPQTPLK